MADVAENAAKTVEKKNVSRMTLKGGIPSSNENEEFVRVDVTDSKAKFGMLNRKTGFVAVEAGKSAEFIKAWKDKEITIKIGAKTRNGNHLVNVIDNSEQASDDTASMEVGDENETLINHEA